MPDVEPHTCSFCHDAATHTCRRCGRAYCDRHGRELCQSCLSPISALPAEGLVRGSLLALGVAAVVGIVLLFWTPTLPGEHRVAKSSAQNPDTVLPAPASTNRSGRSAVPTPLPSVAVTPTVPAVRSYTVLRGDTLFDIANSFGTTVAAIQAANPGITAANLKPGQDLLIPPPGGLVTPVPTPTPTPLATPTATVVPSPTPAATPVPTATPADVVSPTPSG